MTSVVLRDVVKRYGEVEVVHGVSLEIGRGTFTVFVGPSGCGKSTLLRMIAGLESISDGEIFIDGQKVNQVPPGSRGVAMVFQNYALYPHMSVAENMGFGLRNIGMAKAETERRVRQAAQILRIEDFLKRKPKELSGGQRQRVAIGRAIVREPKVFLFDEPLSNLDAALRSQMRLEIAKLHHALDATMIFVTHDQVEAMTMADTIVVLNAGRIEQTGSPLELYNQPRNLFVAGFIGSPKMNFLEGEAAAIDGAAVTVRLRAGPTVHVPVRVPVRPGRLAAGAPVTIGIRPEHLAPADGGDLVGRVEVVERLGNMALLYATLEAGPQIVIEERGAGAAQVGDRIALTLDPAACLLFGPDGEALPRDLPQGTPGRAPRRVATA